MSGSEFALVFAADETFARALAVAMRSALVKLPRGFVPETYVLDNGLSERSRRRLERVAHCARPGEELRWVRVDAERLSHLPTTSRFAAAVYSRLLIPELVPSHVRRAVYLDADVLVLRDVSPLFTIDLADAPFGAVWAVAPDNSDPQPSAGTDPTVPKPTFNTGVLVMDLQRWRSMRLGERALQFAAAQSEPLLLPDQAALNAVTDRWHQLDERWNFQHTRLFLRPPPPTYVETFGRLYRQRSELYRRAAVLHFVGAKPWEPWCTTPGTMAWARTMLSARWYSWGEAAVWLLEWLARRARFYLGSARRLMAGRA